MNNSDKNHQKEPEEYKKDKNFILFWLCFFDDDKKCGKDKVFYIMCLITIIFIIIEVIISIIFISKIS